jgi:translation initiation factor 1A
MPNLQGGKKYKSGKGNNQPRVELHEVGPGQMVGRIIRNPGNRYMLVYCDDDKQRLCKIKGGLRKRVWFSVGDIVLLSVREIGVSMTETTKGERGDILAKYDQTIHSKLKKEYDVNPILFTAIETTGAAIAMPELDEDGFEFEGEGEGDDVDIDAI